MHIANFYCLCVSILKQGTKFVAMTCPVDGQGTWFPSYEHYYSSALPSQSHPIKSKYRPIAPKPPLLPTYSCNSISDFSSALDSPSSFNTGKGNNDTERGRPSRNRRKASGCLNNPSSKGRKRRGPTNPWYLTSSSIRTARPVAGIVRADGTEIVYPFDGSLSVEKLSVGKDSDSIKNATDSTLAERIVLDKRTVVYGGLNIKGMMNSIGEIEVVPVQRMATGAECRCGSAQRFGFSIVSDIENQEEKMCGKNLVTHPLLPEIPCLKGADMGYRASYSTSIVGDTVHNLSKPSASSDKEEIQFRLFGRDVRQNGVGPC